MHPANELGSRGETLAAAYLERRGWRLLDRNWRFHHKEIDLVAERGTVVAFVEVKWRGPGVWGHPLEAVTRRKRRDLETGARGWIARKGRAEWCYRFDVIAVTRVGSGLRLEHVEDAWRL